MDASGCIYVTGISNSFGPDEVVLLKYDTYGGLSWQKTWAQDRGLPAEGYGVAAAAGNIYVTGSTYNDSGYLSRDLLLLKFDSSGGHTWQKTWGGAGTEFGYGVVVDASGNIIVTGSTSSNGTFGTGPDKVAILKFNSTGGLLWQRTWGNSTGTDGYGVAVDASGNIYVTGQIYQRVAEPTYIQYVQDVILLKLDPTGALLWQRTWGGNKTDVGYGVALDASGNVYVTGYTESFGAGSNDVLLLKFNPSGNLLWQKTWGGANNDIGKSVAVDASGNIYVTGVTTSFGAGAHVILLRFDSAGALTSQMTWGGGNDDGQAVALDASGSIYVTGVVGEPGPYTLDSTGNSTLGNPTFILGAPNFSLDTPTFVPQTAAGTVQTPSGSQSYAGGGDLFLFKYGELPTINFQTNPTIGSLSFNGTRYSNGMSGNFTYGTVPISAHPPAGYFFSNWSSIGGIVIANAYDNATTATITGSGTLTANFVAQAQPTPMVTVIFTDSVTNGGTITCSNQLYDSGQTGQFPQNSSLTCQANPVVGYSFMGWSGLVSGSMNPVTFSVSNGGSLTANFAQIPTTPLTPGMTFVAEVAASTVLTAIVRRRKNRQEIVGMPAANSTGSPFF